MSQLPQLQIGEKLVRRSTYKWSEGTRLNSTGRYSSQLAATSQQVISHHLIHPRPLWDRYKHDFRWLFRRCVVSWSHSGRLVLLHAPHTGCEPVRMRNRPHVRSIYAYDHKAAGRPVRCRGYLNAAAWDRQILPGCEPDCDSPEISVVRPGLPNIVAVERLDLPFSGRRRTRGALPKDYALVLGSSHRSMVCRGGCGYCGGSDLVVHRRRNDGTRRDGFGAWGCRVGGYIFTVRRHYGGVCVSAGEFPAYDGVSRTPGGSRRNQTAGLNEQAAETLCGQAGTSRVCALWTIGVHRAGCPKRAFSKVAASEEPTRYKLLLVWDVHLCHGSW